MNINRETNWRMFFSTRRPLVESIALFATSLGIIIFAIIPQFQAFLDVRSQVERERPILSKLETKLANLERAEQSPEFSKLSLVNQALPSKKPLSELLVSLQSSAERSNATIVNFEVSPGELATESAKESSGTKKTTTDYDYLELNVDLEGRFVDIQNFLNAVEQFTPFTVISNVAIDAPAASSTVPDSTQIITSQVTIRTYYSTKSVQAAVEATLPTVSTRDVEVLNELATLVAITVPDQAEIEGGGNEELFGNLDKLFE